MAVRKGQIIELKSGDRFKAGNLLGSGAFGKVFVVNKMGRRGWEDSVTRAVFAMKVIECKDECAIKMAVGEARTLKKVKHENIVQLIHAGLRPVGRHRVYVYLLTEYCSGGNLNNRLRRNTEPSQKLRWLHQLACAITHLHSRRPKIVHRDIKPENVLLTANDDTKVADFGLARQYEALKKLGSSEEVLSYYMNSEVGTRAYFAPEVLSHRYTEKADIFSLGVIFYAILEEWFLEVSRGKRIYGAFVDPGDKTPIGIAMYCSCDSKPREELDFQSTHIEYHRKVARNLQALVLKCLLYQSRKRPKAREIRDELTATNLSYVLLNV